jgi:alcohol dehydrogenase class IV
VIATVEGLLAAIPDDVPTRVRFGPGVRLQAGEVAAGFGRRTILVAGRSAFDSVPGREVRGALADAGVEVVDEVLVAGEPDDGDVLALVARLTTSAPDSIVAMGGGSPLDLAKAAALRPTPARLAELLGGQRTETPGLPVIALPSTAGTGAETSFAAIILDRSAHRKRGVRGAGTACRAALVDPELMAGAPPDVIATAGFDAIAHAVETSASRVADAASVARGGSALRALLEAIPTLLAGPRQPEARWAEAAAAATLMGVNLARSSTCLPHRLQYPVGARTATAHGAGVAALFPAWLERTVGSAPASLAPLARAAGLADADASEAAAATALAEAVMAHLEATGMRRSLRDLGIAAGDLDDLVAAVEGSVANDPGPSATADLRALYAASL